MLVRLLLLSLSTVALSGDAAWLAHAGFVPDPVAKAPGPCPMTTAPYALTRLGHGAVRGSHTPSASRYGLKQRRLSSLKGYERAHEKT